MAISGPAIALLELESIAKGVALTDAVLKRAEVEIALCEPVTPGKFLLLFFGPVAEVQESFTEGLERAERSVLDRLLLPGAADGLLAALEGRLANREGESLGVVETHTVAACLLAADAALKSADVELTRLHLAKGIGGKGWFTCTGPLHMVEAALEAAASAIAPPLLLTTECISRPHETVRARIG